MWLSKFLRVDARSSGEEFRQEMLQNSQGLCHPLEHSHHREPPVDVGLCAVQGPLGSDDHTLVVLAAEVRNGQVMHLPCPDGALFISVNDASLDVLPPPVSEAEAANGAGVVARQIVVVPPRRLEWKARVVKARHELVDGVADGREPDWVLGSAAAAAGREIAKVDEIDMSVK